MNTGNNQRDIPLGMVLDYFTSPDAKPVRVRIKGCRRKANGKREPGMVYMVPVEGGRHKEASLPTDLKDPPIDMFWQMVDDAQLQVVDSPA